MNHRLIIVVSLAASLAFLPITAFAEEVGTEATEYLFQVEATTDLWQQPMIGVRVVDADHGLFAAESLQAALSFTRGKDLEILEKNQTVTLMDTPNDSYYQSGKQWDRAALQIDEYWGAGLTGKGVRIGVIDSGVNRDHEDFVDSHIAQGYDFVEKDADPQDTQGHGTLVTGIIAATARNSLGTAGIAPGVEIVPLKCFDARDSSMEYILQAIYAAVDDYDCDILNMSFGTTENSALLRAAIQYADEHGVLLVAAAGNDGTAASMEDPLNYPAAYEEVIGVGSVDQSLNHAATSQKNDSVFVCAPGESIVGPWIGGEAAYVTKSGTSFAAPCVSGMLALALQQAPGTDRQTFAQALSAAAEDLGPPGWDSSYGWGFVRLPALLRQLANAPAVEVDGAVVTASWEQEKIFPQGTTAYAAAYDDHGVLIDCQRASPGSGGQAQFSLLGPVGSVKIFYLDKTLAPLCPVGQANIS